jgi:integrase
MTAAFNPAPLPQRDGSVTIAELIDIYMAEYTGRDRTINQRLAWWRARIGTLQLSDVNDDHIAFGLEALADQPARFFAGYDADGKRIFKAKRQRLTGSTLNRYRAAAGSVFSFAIRRRIAPKAFIHPCRSVESKPENNARTRFLSDDERTRLLVACKASKWPRLYLLVLLAITTGARKGELLGLRWENIDIERKAAHVTRTKNDDPKVLPLVPAVVQQLLLFKGAPGSLVFPSRVNPSKPMEFTPRWHEALRAAKVTRFTFHGCRHSCASYLAQNGASLLQIGDLLGHRTITMVRRYSHLCSADRSALVDRVMGDLR